MDDTTTTPERAPARHRPRRPRRHERPEPSHGARDIGDDGAAEIVLPAPAPSEPQTAGGGGSGHGPVDDDGRRRPDRNGDDALRFLIAIGLIAVGAGVMGVRLAKAGRRPA